MSINHILIGEKVYLVTQKTYVQDAGNGYRHMYLKLAKISVIYTSYYSDQKLSLLPIPT